MASSSTFAIIEASKDHIEDIVTVTNDAFMADAFFKKPEYVLRFRRDEVVAMLQTENSGFLLAVRDGEVIGSLRLEIEYHNENDGTKMVSTLRLGFFAFL